MVNSTTNYNLNKPLPGTKNYDVLLNQNFDKIDAEIKDKDNKIGILNTQLADIATENIWEKPFMEQLGFVKNAGAMIILGDSLMAGFGLPYSQQYVSKLFEIIKKMNNYMNDFEVVTNFQEDKTINISGTTTIGTKGASKKSIILQPGATITFTGNVQYIDIFYDQTETSGIIEVYRNDVKYKTINCKGTANPYAYSNSESSNYYNTATYTLKCINAAVEILGLFRVQANSLRSSMALIRCGVSATSTTYFSEDTILTYIKHITDNISNKNKIYYIALGTNDIYNPDVANTVAGYSANLEKIILSLKDDANDVRVVLTVPPICAANWTQYAKDDHYKYRNAVYNLAEKYNLSIVDYSYIFFEENGYFQDGVHPNDAGTTEMVKLTTQTLSTGIKKFRYKTIGVATQNGYNNAGGEYGSIMAVCINNKINVTGTVSVGVKTAGTTIATIQDGYAPKQSKLFTLSAFDSSLNIYPILVKVDISGKIITVNNINNNATFFGLDGITYDL